MKHELATIVLWLLALTPTLLLMRNTGYLTFLGPLYFLCIVGSLFILRNAKRKEK